MFQLVTSGKMIIKFDLRFTELQIASYAAWLHVIQDGKLFHNHASSPMPRGAWTVERSIKMIEHRP